ncbi:hypothetical protein N7462_007624 [Penicillium macrosclerotiorum]|uniref:uncharacterized protein n=1 Tax=Penicillium macrosclerotiorum TaxID=303699 RepID=UPI0025467521|nr:uncharacterized protein N7462_007624 [Penicillium macrosclerotiorum]KAJ5679380.1 hypothetical protein N7462_007624 [Penicillium macrosclerotiorum]
MPIPVPDFVDQESHPSNTTGSAGQASLDTVASASGSSSGRHLGTGSGGTVSAPGYSASQEGDQPLNKEEADRLYEERMEEEYAKREGGA